MATIDQMWRRQWHEDMSQIARALDLDPGSIREDDGRDAILNAIARVRRDGGREALDGLAANMTRIANGASDPLTRTSATITARLAEEYKLSVYPEESP